MAPGGSQMIVETQGRFRLGLCTEDLLATDSLPPTAARLDLHYAASPPSRLRPRLDRRADHRPPNRRPADGLLQAIHGERASEADPGRQELKRALERCRRDADVLRVADNILPEVLAMRPAHPWETMARSLDRKGSRRRPDGGAGTGPVLAPDGFVDPAVLVRTPLRRDSDDLVALVALAVRALERPTLADIARYLEGLHVRTPRRAALVARLRAEPPGARPSVPGVAEGAPHFLRWVRTT